jgi:hypothetical protein
VVFEKSSKGLILLGTISEDYLPTIKALYVFSETDDFVIILLNIRIILRVNINILTSGLIVILYLLK